MTSESISNLIERKVYEYLIKGEPIPFIQKELDSKVHKFAASLKDVDEDINVFELISSNINAISPARTRYKAIYIKECLKKIEELNWVIENKYKFPHLSNFQTFKLVKLREKLSSDNAIPF